MFINLFKFQVHFLKAVGGFVSAAALNRSSVSVRSVRIFPLEMETALVKLRGNYLGKLSIGMIGGLEVVGSN